MGTVEAFAARRGKWRDHTITDFQVLHAGSDLMHLPSELMTHNEVSCRWLMASVDVKFAGRILLESEPRWAAWRNTFHTVQSD